jgi:ribosome recycling factor
MDEIDLNDIKRRMYASLEVLKNEFSGLRTGRASANMFETINVNAYGQVMKLRDLATVSVPESKLVSIQVWDASNVSLIEKGVHESGLNLNPQTEGSVIRIIMPELNEERRIELAKTAAKYAENSKIAVRNVRQDGMNMLKRLHQANSYTDDQQRDLADKIQNLTNEVIKSIESLSNNKEEEIKKV